MNAWPKRIIIGVAILALLGTSFFIFGPSPKQDKKVATQQEAQFQPLNTASTTVVGEYNGGKITEGELNTYINMNVFFQPQLAGLLSQRMQEFNQRFLRDLAVSKYIGSKVRSTDDDVKKANQEIVSIEKDLQKFKGTKDSISKMVAGKGFTVDNLKDLIIKSQGSRRFYNSKLEGETFDFVRLRHILISVGGSATEKGKKPRSDNEAKKLATELRDRLTKGEDFSKLAKEYSDDIPSKGDGGKIEGSTDQFVPEFARAAKTLPYGKISDPVKTSYGYHVIKVEMRKKERMNKAPEQVKQLKMKEIAEEIVMKELKFKSLLPNTKPIK